MPYQTTSLNEDEKQLLFTIYRSRLSVLVSGFLLISFLCFYITLSAITNKRHSEPDPSDAWDSKNIRLWTKLAVGSGWCFIMTGSFSYTFFKRVYPFYRDYKCGEKEVVPYTIVRKLDFPITNQYFIGLDDPKYLNHEVDQDFYYKCNEGDTVKLYRAIHSKYVFEKDGRFTLL